MDSTSGVIITLNTFTTSTTTTTTTTFSSYINLKTDEDRGEEIMLKKYEDQDDVTTFVNDSFVSDVFWNQNGTTFVTDDDITSNQENAYYFYKTEQLTFLCILFAMIVLGNSAVLGALMLSKSKKSRMNFFIMQLAVADLSVGLISVLTDIVWKITVTWYAGNIACKIIRFLQVLVTYSSTYVLVALSVDRYDAITHPMNFSGSWRRAKWLIVVAWTVSAVFSIPILILYEEKVIDGQTQCWIELPSRWHWQLYMCLVAVSLFIVPALIITACYTIIVYTIWSKGKILTPMKPKNKNDHTKSFTNDNDVDTKRASSRGLIPKAKIKTVKMTFAIVFVFILCWSPYIIYDLLQVFNYIPVSQTNMAVATFIQSLAPLNSAANPIIYCLFSTHICRNLRKIPFFNWIAEHVCVCCPSLQRPLREAASTRRSDYTTMSESLSRSSRRSNSNSTRHGTNMTLMTSSKGQGSVATSRKYIVINGNKEPGSPNSNCGNSKV